MPLSFRKCLRENGSMQKLRFHPLTPDRWSDLEKLFGERGASGGCWCMWFRIKRSSYEKEKGAANKKAFKKIVSTGKVPGILAYNNGEPVGWCAIEPREAFPVLAGSRILAKVDEKPVWSIVCFFVGKSFRRKGLTVELLKASIQHAKTRGAKILEGYPVDPKAGAMPDAFAYHGLVDAFRKAGFKEVVRRSETRPIMRFYL
jgi:GNAT superfamily N-acetyltransferase